jgi:Lipopolysaccharide-assembly
MSGHRFWAALTTAVGVLMAGCGYHEGGQADLIPKTVKTVAVPPFHNRTIQYRLNDSIPNAIIHEFKARTKYQIVNDASAADVVLEGEIANAYVAPVVSDPASGKATSVSVTVMLNLRLVDRQTNKVLFQKANQQYQDSYEISEDPSKYFDEGDFAWDRVSRTIATQTVSLLLEAF